MTDISRGSSEVNLDRVFNTLAAADPNDFLPGNEAPSSIPALHEIMTALLKLPEEDREDKTRQLGAFEPPNLLASGLVRALILFNQLDSWGPRGVDSAQTLYRSVVMRTGRHQANGGYVPTKEIVDDMKRGGFGSDIEEIQLASGRLQKNLMVTQRDRKIGSGYFRLIDPVRAVLMSRRNAVYLDRVISEAPEEIHAAGKLFWIITTGGIKGDGRGQATLSELANLIHSTDDPPLSLARRDALQRDEVLQGIDRAERAAVIAQRLGRLPLFKMSHPPLEAWISWR